MHYSAKFERDGDGWLVTFPAVPEAVTGGADEREARANAVDALETALLTYAKDGRDLPANAPFVGGVEVTVSASVLAKLLFIEAFRKSGLTRVGLAQMLGKGENEVRRMLDPYYGSKLPQLEVAMEALGKRYVLSSEDAVFMHQMATTKGMPTVAEAQRVRGIEKKERQARLDAILFKEKPAG